MDDAAGVRSDSFQGMHACAARSYGKLDPHGMLVPAGPSLTSLTVFGAWGHEICVTEGIGDIAIGSPGPHTGPRTPCPAKTYASTDLGSRWNGSEPCPLSSPARWRGRQAIGIPDAADDDRAVRIPFQKRDDYLRADAGDMDRTELGSGVQGGDPHPA